MTNLVKSELFKLRTTSLAWILGGIWIALTAVIAGMTAYFTEQVDIGTVAQQEEALRFSWSILGLLLVPVIGVSVATADTSHRTLGMTLLNQPQRERVVAAKALTALIAGAALGFLTGLASLIVGVVVLAGDGKGSDLVAEAGVQFLIAAAVYGALLCLFGFGVGLLINNQTAAIVVTIAFFLVIESIFSLLLVLASADGLLPWLPGSAARQAAQLLQQDPTADGFGDDISLYSPAVSSVILLGWGVALSALGALRLKRSDVT